MGSFASKVLGWEEGDSEHFGQKEEEGQSSELRICGLSSEDHNLEQEDELKIWWRSKKKEQELDLEQERRPIA